MGFTESISTVFSKYATFSGRAIRSEYWWFYLAMFISSFVASFVEVLLFGPESILLYSILVLVTFLPWLAVTTRRLHDINKSGWWQLIVLTIVGIPVLIYWLCKKSDEQENRFGPPQSI